MTQKIQQGPLFEILRNCKGCNFLLERTISAPAICTKLSQDLYLIKNNIVSPHKDCPFLINSQFEFYKTELEKLQLSEAIKLKKLILSIFKEGQEYTYDPPSDSISLKNDDDITIDQIQKFQELLPEYYVTFSPYSSDTISIEIYKRKEKNE